MTAKRHCEKMKHLEERKAKRIARRSGMGHYWHEECQAWHVGHAQRADATGLRLDVRYGRIQRTPYGVYIECPVCRTFTGKLGDGGAAKCTECLRWVTP